MRFLLMMITLLGLPCCRAAAESNEPNATAPLLPGEPQKAGQTAPAEQVVVLKNGRTLRGQVALEAKRCRVSLAYGDILLRAEEVSAVCDDLPDAYRTLSQRGDAGSVEHHLRMALWCVEQELFTEAENELRAAEALDGEDRRLDYVRRRLALAREPKGKATGATPSESEKRIATVAELDRLVRNLPRGTAETFANVVQPLLLSRCGTSGCHSVSSNLALKFLRPPAARGQAARVTQRNLHSVLQYVDQSDPERSPILQAAHAGHAGLPGPLLNGQEQGEVQQLVQWIRDVTAPAKPQPSPQPATISAIKPAPWGDPQLNQMRPPAGLGRGPLEEAAGERAADEGAPRPGLSARANQTARRPAARPAAAPDRDEFDPDLFNRQIGQPPD
jgi:hypothetical protein